MQEQKKRFDSESSTRGPEYQATWKEGRGVGAHEVEWQCLLRLIRDEPCKTRFRDATCTRERDGNSNAKFLVHSAVPLVQSPKGATHRPPLNSLPPLCPALNH